MTADFFHLERQIRPDLGAYSGPGVVNGSFYSAIAITGTHTIVYTFTDATCCNNVASSNITINSHTIVSLGAFNLWTDTNVLPTTLRIMASSTI